MGYASADLVARQPVYPGPDLAAYPDRREADLYARQPVYPGPDLCLYPWGFPAPFVAAVGGSTLTLTPDLGAMTLGQGAAPSLGGADPGSMLLLLLGA